jgi:hypothetical protein
LAKLKEFDPYEFRYLECPPEKIIRLWLLSILLKNNELKRCSSNNNSSDFEAVQNELKLMSELLG